MANVIDVAQYIYDRKKWVDSWTLQKLTYYAKAWSLAWDGDQLFEEKFQAWPDGPVSATLYRKNKYERTHMFSDEIPDADTSLLSTRQKSVIDSVIEFYGRMTKDELIECTHQEAPWIEARGTLSLTAQSTELLSEDTMRATYTLQSLNKGNVPVPPIVETPGCVEIDDAVVDAQVAKWAGTLDWLVTR